MELKDIIKAAIWIGLIGACIFLLLSGTECPALQELIHRLT